MTEFLSPGNGSIKVLRIMTDQVFVDAKKMSIKPGDNELKGYLHCKTITSQNVSYEARVLSKHFCLQPFFPKDSVSLLFAQLTISMRCFHGWHQRKNFEVQISRLLEIGFQTLFLTAEAQLVHHLFAVAAIFLEILEFHGEFYKIQFHNSVQD